MRKGIAYQIKGEIRRQDMADVKIAKGYIPGSIGRVAELHDTYYHQNWDFKLFFEAKVASEISEFLGRYNERQDGFWTASIGVVWKAPLPSMVFMLKKKEHIFVGLSFLMSCVEKDSVIG